jgi:hypothetical protein
MATAAILKKINPIQHNFTWHMIFLQGFIKFDQGISIGLTNGAAVTMETKKGGFKIILDSFHQTS